LKPFLLTTIVASELINAYVYVLEETILLFWRILLKWMPLLDNKR